MTTQTSLFSASRPGVFVEAVSLAARSSHREPSTWVTKPSKSRPYARSVVAGLSVVIAVVGVTLLMAA
jgi:hypothetical protein